MLTEPLATLAVRIEVTGSDVMTEPAPLTSRPRMFGREPAGPSLPWSWADERLGQARNYWVTTASRSGRPHARPFWGLWEELSFDFSTGSRTLANIHTNSQVTVHLESGRDVVIVEGDASVILQPARLQNFVEAYNGKYGGCLEVRGHEVGDDTYGNGGVVVVRAVVIYGWAQSVETATRWDVTSPT